MSDDNTPTELSCVTADKGEMQFLEDARNTLTGEADETKRRSTPG